MFCVRLAPVGSCASLCTVTFSTSVLIRAYGSTEWPNSSVVIVLSRSVRDTGSDFPSGNVLIPPCEITILYIFS